MPSLERSRAMSAGSRPGTWKASRRCASTSSHVSLSESMRWMRPCRPVK
ncbi:hypothetical protein ACN28S_28120 [Cystobacter fuscus]